MSLSVVGEWKEKLKKGGWTEEKECRYGKMVVFFFVFAYKIKLN